jgi:hypothetical protein
VEGGHPRRYRAKGVGQSEHGRGCAVERFDAPLLEAAQPDNDAILVLDRSFGLLDGLVDARFELCAEVVWDLVQADDVDLETPKGVSPACRR